MDVPAELLRAFSSRYRIERKLGHGGMADVYLAYDKKQKRQVALKVLNRALAVERERFDDEIKTLANLVAPHIVSVFESGVEADSLYYTMEFVAGETLAARIDRDKQLPIADVWRIGREVADALKSAHASGVIHRDIKPGNILLTTDHAWVADFGIAKAITENVAKATPWSTATGVLLGTPPYMSPEQASSGAVLDGRTDIYSLGCVLYEALTGRPPFQGDTPQSILASHLTDPAPSLRRLRRDVPPGLARIVKKALEKRREDRFASAAVMLEALRVGDVAATPVRDVARWVADHWPWVTMAAVVVIGLAFWLTRAPPLDPDRYVVVPFAHRSGAAPGMLNGDQCEALLSQSLGRWSDLQLVDPILVRDWLLRHNGLAAVSFDVARRLARALGAGKLVWGDVQEPDDSITVSATIYDMRYRNREVRRHSVRIGPQSRLGERFENLANALLLGREASAAPAASTTTSYHALLAYADGDAALKRWDLDSAERAFRSALDLDPAFPYAHLWLAHAGAWAARSTNLWRAHAEAAAGNAARLGWRDSILAGALLALATGDYAQSCARYERLLRRDSTHFAEWFGLGDCLARDSVVVRDDASPSRWRFRSSYHTAAQAYTRALRMVPSMHRAFRGSRFDALLARLRRVFFTETRLIRLGRALGSNEVFAAFPALIGDTVAFVPRLRSDLSAGAAGVRPPTLPDAVMRSRERLREIILSWIEAYPASADVYEALAHVLETTGEIVEAQPETRSALLTVRHARRLSRDASQDLRLAVAEARLLVKLQKFGEARRMAEVELARWPNPSPTEAGQLAGLAALIGRAHKAAQLLSAAASSGPFDPLPLAVQAATLQAYAAIGQPVDSITLIAARVERDIQIRIAQPNRRSGVRDTLLLHAAFWSWPLLGTPIAHNSRIVRMQSAADRHDTTTVLRLVAELRALRQGMSPGEIAIDGIVPEARVLLAVGERREAEHMLDESLGALDDHGTGLLRVEQAGALGRAMALRVRLALDAGDSSTTRRWAAALSELWRNADAPDMRAVADSMQRLSRRPNE